jgi:phosphatidate cytidylyltransferase
VLRHRLTLGPVLIALLLGGLWLDEWLDRQPAPSWLTGGTPPGVGEAGGPVDATFPPGIIVFVVVLTLGLAAARELARMLRDKGIAASTGVCCAASAAGLFVLGLVPTRVPGTESAAIVASTAAAVLVGSLVYYARKRKPEGVLAAAGGTVLAFIYLGLMLGFFVAIRREQSAWTLLWVVLSTKACDIGAYFTGRTLGKRKLIFWLSPGKTWEGLFGGILFSMLVAVLGGLLLERLTGRAPAPLPALAFAGAIFAVVGQAGDLLVSLFKRDAGRKDSGRSIPGFGGVLDVIDSAVLVAPFAYWWLRVW